MSSTCKQIRQAAWNILWTENTFWKLLGAWAVLHLIGIFVSMVLTAALTGSWRMDSAEGKPLPVSVVDFIFSSVSGWGFVSMTLAVVRGEKNLLPIAFCGFTCPFRAIGFNLALSLIMLLWFLPAALLLGGLSFAALYYIGGWVAFTIIGVCTAVFVVFAVMISYRYALAWYVKIENPQLGMFDAIRKSAKLIRGYKKRLFKLHLSYLIVVWCVLIPFFGAVFYLAYVSIGTVIFYRQVAYAAERDGQES